MFFASSIMKNIVACWAWFPVKLIFVYSNLLLSSCKSVCNNYSPGNKQVCKKQPGVQSSPWPVAIFQMLLYVTKSFLIGWSKKYSSS